MAHTPGPWELWFSEDSDNRGAFVVRGGSKEPHGTDMVIAKRDIGTPNGDEGEANARLIAAAPELLDALKALREFALNEDVSVECDDSCELGCIFCAAKAAIAKAEGR